MKRRNSDIPSPRNSGKFEELTFNIATTTGQTDLTPAMLKEPVVRKAYQILLDQLGAAEKELATTQVLLGTDELTGLPNRRIINTAIHWEIARAKENAENESKRRTQYPAATVLFIDIDNFKAFNDEHSTAGGDIAIEHVAKLLRTNLRQADLIGHDPKENTVGRLGGDDFVAVLPNTNEAEAKEAIKRIQDIIQKTPFKYKNSPCHVTVSAEAVQIKGDDTLQSVYERSSIAMKHAKVGKRVSFFGDPGTFDIIMRN